MEFGVGSLHCGGVVASEPRRPRRPSLAARWSTGACVNSLPPGSGRICLAPECFADRSHRRFYGSLHAQRKGKGVNRERQTLLGFAGGERGVFQSEVPPEALVRGCSSPALGYDFAKELASLKLRRKEEKQQRKARKRALKARESGELRDTTKMKKKKAAKKCASSSSSSSESSSSSSDSTDCEDEQLLPTAGVAGVISRSGVERPAGKGREPPQELGGTLVLTERLAMASCLAHLPRSMDPKMAAQIEVCVGGKCRRAGSPAVFACLQQSLSSNSGVSASTCKCMGRCDTPINVRVCMKEKMPELHSHVQVEDVGLLLRHRFGVGDYLHGILVPSRPAPASLPSPSVAFLSPKP